LDKTENGCAIRAPPLGVENFTSAPVEALQELQRL
jgi:hypothetical protein